MNQLVYQNFVANLYCNIYLFIFHMNLGAPQSLGIMGSTIHGSSRHIIYLKTYELCELK